MIAHVCILPAAVRPKDAVACGQATNSDDTIGSAV